MQENVYAKKYTLNARKQQLQRARSCFHAAYRHTQRIWHESFSICSHLTANRSQWLLQNPHGKQRFCFINAQLNDVWKKKLTIENNRGFYVLRTNVKNCLSSDGQWLEKYRELQATTFVYIWEKIQKNCSDIFGGTFERQPGIFRMTWRRNRTASGTTFHFRAASKPPFPIRTFLVGDNAPCSSECCSRSQRRTSSHMYFLHLNWADERKKETKNNKRNTAKNEANWSPLFSS